MNKILKFERVNYEKYNTIRINIENGIFSLKEHGKTLQIDKWLYMVIKKLLYRWNNPIYAI